MSTKAAATTTNFFVRAKKAYDAFMKRFKASNGQEVVKTVTPSGVTAYCASSVPQEALRGLRDKLLTQLGMSLTEFRETYGYQPKGKKGNPAR
ncbi:hypothetical protein [Burkholderia sp. MBR-1]|uniref:hypothetical protein n=1 Tax=Burkholderia sp. MBR-1 TaxID=2732364 RepID=UPI0015EEA857|nr:hypothetical protein [Burkholderia sp. MBR-1]QMI49746.1 hypothetical protein MBR110_30185 [Burkholderia sp. MBR-1]